LALFGLGVILFFVFVAIYATSQPLPYYEMEPYCGTNFSNPSVLTTQNTTNAVPTPGLPNGTYSWQVLPVTGFTAIPSNGTVQVAGKGVIVSILFKAAPPASPVLASTSTGLTTEVQPSYSVIFVESGLPAQKLWRVAMNYTSPNY